MTAHTVEGSSSAIVRSWQNLFLDAYRAEDEDFVRCVGENREPGAGGLDGKAAVMVVNAGNRSIVQRRPVHQRGRNATPMTRARAMLAATYTQGVASSFSIQEVATPEIGSDEILLRVRAASICGTDVKIVRSGHRKLQDGQQIVLGHEFIEGTSGRLARGRLLCRPAGGHGAQCRLRAV